MKVYKLLDTPGVYYSPARDLIFMATFAGFGMPGKGDPTPIPTFHFESADESDTGVIPLDGDEIMLEEFDIWGGPRRGAK